MSILIQADTLGDCWLKSMAAVMHHGRPCYDEDVSLLEVLGLTVSIKLPNLDDEIIKRYGDAQVVAHTLSKFAKNVVMTDRPFTYGDRIYNKRGVDQFEWMVDRLTHKPESKSATICLLDEGTKSPNIPCLTTIDAKIREGFLDLQFFYRSQNIVGRQYANILALAKLQHDLAQRLNVKVGFMGGYVASAHIYEYDKEYAELISQQGRVVIQDRFYSHGPKSIRESFSAC